MSDTDVYMLCVVHPTLARTSRGPFYHAFYSCQNTHVRDGPASMLECPCTKTRNAQKSGRLASSTPAPHRADPARCAVREDAAAQGARGTMTKNWFTARACERPARPAHGGTTRQRRSVRSERAWSSTLGAQSSGYGRGCLLMCLRSCLLTRACQAMVFSSRAIE
jgi:hypothetical protein